MASGLCVPHQQAAHMAAPTEGQNIKNTLANGEPSTHGAKRTLRILPTRTARAAGERYFSAKMLLCEVRNPGCLLTPWADGSTLFSRCLGF
jgi:hypothetical protein